VSTLERVEQLRLVRGVGRRVMLTGNRKTGARDNGKPGERSYTKGYYAAYLLDLEGNNIECLYYQPWWLSMCPIHFPRLPLSQLFNLFWWWRHIKSPFKNPYNPSLLPSRFVKFYFPHDHEVEGIILT
jgi:hypothetical protein